MGWPSPTTYSGYCAPDDSKNTTNRDGFFVLIHIGCCINKTLVFGIFAHGEIGYEY